MKTQSFKTYSVLIKVLFCSIGTGFVAEALCCAVEYCWASPSSDYVLIRGPNKITLWAKFGPWAQDWHLWSVNSDVAIVIVRQHMADCLSFPGCLPHMFSACVKDNW